MSKASARIDLDNLERKAKAATPGPWSRCEAQDGQCPCRTIWSIPLDEIPFRLAPSEPGPDATVKIEDWDHVVTNDPTTTLALVARIRELESALTDALYWLKPGLDERAAEMFKDRGDLLTVLYKKLTISLNPTKESAGTDG